MINYNVVIPEWENSYLVAKKTKAKYWLFKDKDKLPKKYLSECKETPIIVSGKAYCCTESNERFIKNSIKAGNPKRWILNGQDLYSAVLNWRMRKNIALYYHEYFSKFIKEQLEPIIIPENTYLSISCDIYEIERGNMPDASNMWLLEKFFEDALVESGIIPDDGPKYVRESGRKRYHFVTEESDRKLIFNIKEL
jgi:hypothetical protein